MTVSLRTPTKRRVRDVRSFVGFASYYHRFIPHFATIAKPLHILMAKNQRFKWGPDEEEVFKGLCDRLATAPTLDYPDFSLPFILDTDATDTCIVAVLSQCKDGVEKVVAYGSRVRSPAESRDCEGR